MASSNVRPILPQALESGKSGTSNAPSSKHALASAAPAASSKSLFHSDLRSIDPGIAHDPPHSVEDNSHTVRKFDIDDARSRCRPKRGFGAEQDEPFAPACSRCRRTDPTGTGPLPISAAIPVLVRLRQARKLF